MPLQATSGAASYDAFGGGVAAVPNYIEDVFSTWLYTGTGAAQTITNGIDTATYGAMVWSKSRSNAISNIVVDSVRGGTNALITNSTDANSADTGFHVSSFNSNGYSLQGAGSGDNASGYTYVSWTFRKQPKFFDVVTYTGTGSNTTIAHSLGSVPGTIIVKRTDTTADWQVYHRSLANTQYMVLNSTAAAATGATRWNSTTPTSTVFSLGTDSTVNASGGTYVAYIFAHNAGGFGLTGTDNVISCGSFTNDGSGFATVNLGYEPQWVLTKRINGTSPWAIGDTMRGLTATGADEAHLYANTSGAEVYGDVMDLTSTGFYAKYGGASAQYIYIAIRRGPMKVPTTGASVFAPILAATSPPVFRASFRLDSVIAMARTAGSHYWGSRLTGTGIIDTTSTAAESAYSGETWDYQTSMGNYTSSPADSVGECFQRAPGFFDEVCYTGNSTSGLVVNHNLSVVPELVIFKKRDASGGGWPVWTTSVGTGTSFNYLNSTAAVANQGVQIFTASPTSTTMTLGSWTGVNNTGTMVAYLFASAPGVSKVGSYTGNGTTQAIACGFTGGARFVLIKRTDSTGDWYVYDTARGMTVMADPYLRLNSTAAETATLGSVITSTGGFTVNAAILAAINTNAASYIFLAIA